VRNKKSILIIVRDDASSTMTWSGIPFHIIRILKDYGHNVSVLDNLGFPKSIHWRFKRIAGRFFSGFSPKYYSEISSKYFGRKINKYLKKTNKNFDFILAIDFLEGVLNIKTKVPVLVYRDASYALLNKLGYPGFDKFNKESLEVLLELERKCLERVDKMLFTSKWAIEETQSFYPMIEKKKYFVQPFSSQLYPPPSKDDWRVRYIGDGDIVNFLFVGRDWKRKGGDDALEILRSLAGMGFRVHLTVVGHRLNTEKLDFPCEVIENLDVSDQSDLHILKGLYLNSHFFILPTEVEAFGIVFSEAMSLGLPVITTKVCAIPEILVDGREGILIDNKSGLDVVVQKIIQLLKDKDEYKQMQINASNRFVERFHPNLWVDRLIDIYEEKL
jgi:glycosyltransferase involved in cell wall biosynthesis